MVYQSITAAADSDSIGKAQALKLPTLVGKRFLDLGCNDGFFCGLALSGGAALAVGIDSEESSIERARTFFPDATFYALGWDRYLQDCDHFDVIVLASAIHYAENQKDLIQRILAKLTPAGVFVLEAGMVDVDGPDDVCTVDRWDGPKQYFRTSALKVWIESLGFTVVRDHPSVTQSGDSVSRRVFHIRRRVVPILINNDPPDRGKSELGKLLYMADLAWISIDDLTCTYVSQSNDPFLNMFIDEMNVVQNYTSPEKIVDLIVEKILSTDRSKPCYVEGYLSSEIRAAFLDRLSEEAIPHFDISAYSNTFSSKEVCAVQAVMTPIGSVFINRDCSGGHIDHLSVISRNANEIAMFVGWLPNEAVEDLDTSEVNNFFTIVNGEVSAGRVLKTFAREDIRGIGYGFEAYVTLMSGTTQALLRSKSENKNATISVGLLTRNRNIQQVTFDPTILDRVTTRSSPLD